MKIQLIHKFEDIISLNNLLEAWKEFLRGIGLLSHGNTWKIREIAERKMEDLNANDIEAAIKIIGGSARSMGVEIVNK